MKRILLFLFFCLHIPALAQTPVYYQFTPNNGLPSNETYDLAIDSVGYIWIGTDRGLARFDGRNFKVFTVNDGLSDNVVDRIIVSPKGKVWVMGKNNILHYLEGDSFKTYRLANELASIAWPGYLVFLPHILFIQEEPVCFATNTHGLVWIKNNRVVTEKNDSATHLRLDLSHNMAGLLEDYTLRGYQIYKRRFEFRGKVYKDKENFYNRPSLIPLPNGNTLLAAGRWIFTLRNGMVIDEDTLETAALNLFKDRKGAIWVCLLDGGVRRFDAGTPVTSGNQGTLYFPDDRVTDVLQDYEGGYWFTTYNRGVLYLPDPDITYQHPPADIAGRSFVELTGDGKNRIFLATQLKEIYSMQNDSISFMTRLLQRHSRPSCLDLYYDNRRKEIVAACSDGTYRINSETRKTIINLSSTKASCADRSGEVMTIVGQGYIKHYYLKTGDSIRYYYRGEDFFSVYYDRENQCWVGGHKGLFRYDGKQVFTSSIHGRINSIKQLDNGLLVMATLGRGLVILKKGKSPEYLSLGSSVQQNMVNDLAVSGNIVWAATEKGIIKVDLTYPALPKFTIWSVETGFPWNDMRKIYVQAGKVYVLTQNKLVTIKENPHQNLHPPRIFLNRILVNDSLSLSPDSSVHLPYTSSRFKFFFNGIAFRSGNALRYQYRLIGVDDDWYTVTQPFVEIPFLAPGDYRFELVALNEDNVRSTTPIVYSFSIARPFWEQWWFLSGILICTTLLAGVFVRNRFLREKQRNQEREMSLQYEQQALSAQITPHFIFNVLNSVQNFILHEDKRNAIKYLGRFSKLMRMNLENARHKWITLEDELQLLEAYLELQKLRYKDKFTYSVQTAGDSTRLIQIPSMLIQPFVENAIMHGMNNLTGRTGMIEIWISYGEGMVRCIVEDNGIGREKASQLREHHRESAGMNITRERLQLLWAETGTLPFFEVIDKQDEQGNAAGTTVIFSLPYKKVDSPLVTS